jgi:hypothetical protein
MTFKSGDHQEERESAINLQLIVEIVTYQRLPSTMPA